MVARWGMTADLGPVDFRQSEDHPFLGQSIARPRAHADATAAQIDAAVIGLLKEAERQATTVLEGNRDRVTHLISELEARETLGFEEIQRCLDPNSKVTPLARAPDLSRVPESPRQKRETDHSKGPPGLP